MITDAQFLEELAKPEASIGIFGQSRISGSLPKLLNLPRAFLQNLIMRSVQNNTSASVEGSKCVNDGDRAARRKAGAAKRTFRRQQMTRRMATR